MTEPTRGLLDTSVIVGLRSIRPSELPDQSAVSAVTLAELSSGTHTAVEPLERARRQARLEWVSTEFATIPFGPDEARMFGQAVAAVRASGRKERRRVADLLIASTAAAQGLALYTLNPDDLAGLDHLVDVVPVA